MSYHIFLTIEVGAEFNGETVDTPEFRSEIKVETSRALENMLQSFIAFNFSQDEIDDMIAVAKENYLDLLEREARETDKTASLRINILEQALEEILKLGIHADTMPTMHDGNLAKPGNIGYDPAWICSYLQSADDTVRAIAAKALRDSKPLSA